jgi:hypothetical protein
MSNRFIVISTLVCGDCGSKFPIPRKANQLREYGHIKDLWCYKCKRVAKFVENVLPQEIENRFALGANNPGFT